MKKILFLLPAILLIAAGCNSGGNTSYNVSSPQPAAPAPISPQIQAQASGKISDITSSLNQDSNNESAKVQQSSESDVMQSDGTDLNSVSGVANDTSY